MLERSPAPLPRPADLRFQEQQWVLSRGVWALLAGVALAALIVFFGTGPSSTKRASSTALTLSYSGLERVQNPTQLEVTVRSVQGQTFELWLSRDYLESARLERVTPPPLRVRQEGDEVVYTFAGKVGVNAVRFDLEFERMGIKNGYVGLSRMEALEVRQWVYP